MKKSRFVSIFSVCLILFSISPSSIAAAVEPSDYMRQNILMLNPNSSCGDVASSYTVTGDSNPAKIFNLLIERGLNDIQAAGILGNIQSESGFSPTREEDSGGGGWGLVQWTGGRRGEVISFLLGKDPSLSEYVNNSQKYGSAVRESEGFKHPNIPDDINNTLIALEIEYLYTESTTTQKITNIQAMRSAYHVQLRERYAGKTIWDAIKSAPTLKEASDIFMLGFERPKFQDAEKQQARADMGQAMLDKLKASPGATNITPAGSVEGEVSGSNVLIIGDSLTVGAQDKLSSALSGVTIDGEVGRQSTKFAELAKSHESNGGLKDIVVMSLATNGAVAQETLDGALTAIGNRKLILVTAYAEGRSWIESNNKLLKDFASKHPDQVKVADWFNSVNGKVDMLSSDNVHPTDKGSQLYTDTIVNSVKSFGTVGSSSDSARCADLASSSNVAAGGSIVETAKSLAHHTTAGPSGPRDEYVKAHATYNGWFRSDSFTYTDCGVFVGTVMRMSVDPDFPTHYSPTQINYTRSHPDKYQIIENPTMENIQPGDIMLDPGHSAFYGGDLGNGYNIIDASAKQRVPSFNSYAAYYLRDSSVIVARYIGPGVSST